MFAKNPSLAQDMESFGINKPAKCRCENAMGTYLLMPIEMLRFTSSYRQAGPLHQEFAHSFILLLSVLFQS